MYIYKYTIYKVIYKGVFYLNITIYNKNPLGWDYNIIKDNQA